jgi:hypothetical protein
MWRANLNFGICPAFSHRIATQLCTCKRCASATADSFSPQLTWFRLVLAVVLDAMAAAGCKSSPAREGPMQSFEMSSVDAAAPDLADGTVTLSAGWLLRRTILWMLLVGLGIAGSCLLYTAADSTDADTNSPQKSASLADQH